jgi:hypothetical protein
VETVHFILPPRRGEIRENPCRTTAEGAHLAEVALDSWTASRHDRAVIGGFYIP